NASEMARQCGRSNSAIPNASERTFFPSVFDFIDLIPAWRNRPAAGHQAAESIWLAEVWPGRPCGHIREILHGSLVPVKHTPASQPAAFLPKAKFWSNTGQRKPMNPVEALGLALGAGFSSGLNLYATVATLGLLQRFGLIHLPASLEVVSHPIVLGIAVALYL